LSFYVCFGYDLCLYEQNDDYYAIFIEFGDVGNMRDEFDYDQVINLNHEILNLS